MYANSNTVIEPGTEFSLRSIIQNRGFKAYSAQKINLAKIIKDYKQIENFLDYIHRNNINLFLPNDCFITIFHSLLQSWRWQ